MLTSEQVRAGPSSSSAHAPPWVGIIDDDMSIRHSVARVFRCHGISAETFSSADAYLLRARTGLPACLVLDIHLGGMSGLELRDRLVTEGIAVPIAFITGHDDIRDEARSFGESTCLRKPFSSEALLAFVRRHIPARS